MDVSALFGRTPQQQTLAAPVEVTGRTLHSGEIARMTLHPANPGLGICFSRSDRTFADGLIHATTLPRDYYELGRDKVTLVGQRSGFTIALGERVRVKIASVNPENAKVDFQYVGPAEA